jgi:pyruvate kinase
VPVDDAAWLERRQPGDRLEFVDSREARRHWVVVETRADGCMVTATQTAYVSSGTTLVCTTTADHDAAVVGVLPEVEQVHRIDAGDHVTLTASLEPAEPTAAGSEHRIGCTLPEVFEQAKPGERVWLDDGKIGGVIVRVTPDEIDLRVTDVRPGGVNLKAGKGINVPDTDLRLDALTAKDLDDIDFVAANADMVNLSFVRDPADVEQLQAELLRRGAADVGIVLKIENVAAFEHLPELLLTAMRSRKVGVMIARGDLAVEVGFERLAEVQEEILWACEAAHVPVIWATQVLDTLARTGQPSRAEITDAAMSERAECVMLNKGPHITDAIRTLDSILTRMQHHQHKKRSLLRRLQAWDSAPTA